MKGNEHCIGVFNGQSPKKCHDITSFRSYNTTEIANVSLTDCQRHYCARGSSTLPPPPPWRPSIRRVRAPSWIGRTVADPSPDTLLAVPGRRGEWPCNDRSTSKRLNFENGDRIDPV